ncbi:MAG: dockerin type I domain-containing protein [Candidatus Fimenecus sp.]
MKRTVSILLTFVLLCSTLCIGASALEKPTVFRGAKHTYSIDRSNPPAVAETARQSVFGQKVNLKAEDPNTPFTYYSNLNANGKAIYNAVVAATDLENAITVTLPEPIAFIGTMDSEGYVDMPEETLNAYVETVLGAFTAVVFDHPEQFWVNMFATEEWFDAEPISGDFYRFSLVSVDITLRVPAGYPSWTAVKQDYTAMMNAAKAVIAEGTTRFDKLKTLHDWVAQATTYDNNFKDTAYYATSVFLAPHQSVCEGYSEAFKILCDLAGIPCIIAVSAEHEWNHVKMEDGKWYAVDITWDDQDSTGMLVYDFFLVGSQTRDVYFDGNTFASEHPYTGNIYGEYCATCPTLSATAYLPMFLNNHSGASVDKAAKTVYLYDDETIEHAFIAAPGMYITLSDSEQELWIVKDGDIVDSYTIVRPTAGVAGSGDVNGDGRINAVDARWVLQAASGARTLTVEQKTCADLNGDGRINAVDARWILQVASGARDLSA